MVTKCLIGANCLYTVNRRSPVLRVCQGTQGLMRQISLWDDQPKTWYDNKLILSSKAGVVRIAHLRPITSSAEPE